MAEGIKSWMGRNRKFLLAVPVSFVLVWSIRVMNFSVSEVAPGGEDESIYGRSFPRDLNFAGEKVPGNELPVREAFSKEMGADNYWKSKALTIHRRASRWFPIIEPILKKHGIPDDFKFIAVVESGLTNLVSPKQATGYWQFIESTALQYGLQVDPEVDERYNVERSTEAACKFFKDAYKQFGNWTLVAAAYNMGSGGVEGQLKKQNVRSYYDLLLNRETSRYVFKVLAVKELYTRPEDYGITVRRQDLYKPLPVNKVTVDSSINNLESFAANMGVSYRLLKIFNPWLRGTKLTNHEAKKYVISLPAKDYLASSFEEEATGAFDSITRNDTMKPLPANVVLTADTGMKAGLHHKVKEGETMAAIAKHYKIEEAALRAINRLAEKQEPKPGQELLVQKPQKK